MTAREPDRRCQCPTGVDCLVTQVLGGADQCMHEATAEDLLCDLCRGIPQHKSGVRVRHCHSCGQVRGPLDHHPAGEGAALWPASASRAAARVTPTA